MDKKFIEDLENKAKDIVINETDPFVVESCKNIFKALLVVAENENPPINDISNILNDTNKTIELLKKFDGINKEKYQGTLSYIVVDINNNQTLLYLIELLKQSMNYNDKSDDNKENSVDEKNKKEFNIDIINTILSSVFETSQIVKIEKIASIKFFPSKVGYTIEIKDNHNKFFYMGASEYGYVEIVREYSSDGKIIYAPNDDYIPTVDNSNNSSDIINGDYIVISSTGYFSKKKFNNCIVDLKDNRIYDYTYDSNGNDKYNFYKDLNTSQKDKLMKYIYDNDLLNVSIDKLVFDASDIIEINISGKKKIIRNASKEFTNNEMHIFDDIVDIVFNNGNSPLGKIKDFFHIDLSNNKDVVKFAKEHGYDGAKYIGVWKEYKVYEPYMDDKQVSYIGLPLVILVNEKGEIRMSTSDEAMAALDDKSFMESYEENKINEELNFSNRQEAVDAYINKFGGFPFISLRGLPDEIVIEKIKNALINNEEISVEFDDNSDLLKNINDSDSFIREYKVDENGREYEEIKNIASIDKMPNHDINNLITNIDEKIAELEKEKNSIDKEIAENFEEVSKYSILNKTLEELLSAKKKFINDWDILLFNTKSEHWIMNSATYRVHIHSIIDAILRRTDDNVSKQQLELLNTITENKYFGNQDRDSVIKIVKQLKELESK